MATSNTASIGTVNVLRGRGDGTFYPSIEFATPIGRFEAGTHGDFNGDGAVDLAYPSTSGLTVLTNDNADSQNLAGAITFQLAAPNLTPATAIVNVTGQVARLAISAPAATTAGDTFNVNVAAIDTNGEVATGYSTTVHFASNDTLGGLPADYTFTPADAGTHVFAVTLKSSGSRFISAVELGGSIQGGVSVSVAPQVATTLVLAGAAGAIGVTRPVTIAARDVFGNSATGYVGTVHFTSSDPAAVLPADVALSNGSALVNVNFFTVGIQTLTATDVVTSSITGTLSSNATAAVPAAFSIAGFPSTNAGQFNNFTVRVMDTIGQTATGYVGTVYFTSSDVQAGLPAMYTFTAADSGVHSFTVTLKTAGTQSMTVRDLTGSLIGTQAGISVSSAAFSRFSLSVPNGADSKGHILVTAGEAISLTVKAADVYGNSVTGYAGNVAISCADPLANVPANYTFTTSDAGLHTFTVDLRTATPNGSVWSFNVADVALASTVATITNFEVVNAVASSLTVSAPTRSDAGAGFISKVTILDSYGNKVKNYFGTIHFSSSALNARLPANYSYNSNDAGVHDFAIALNTSGIQSLSAMDTADTFVFGSASLTVTSGAATTIAIAAPQTTTAGVAQTINVSVLDAFGNLATGYRGTVVFASSDAQAVLPANYTFGNKDSGFHALTATLKTAGTSTLSLSDVANATLAKQVTIKVNAETSAGSFTVVGIPTTVAGAAQSFTVTVKDAFGNLASGYTGNVVFSSSDAQAGLPANYRFTTAADAGAHTFSAILKTAGTKSISATTGALIGSQAGIVVTAGAVSNFKVLAPTITQGVGFKLTVTALDAFGNIVTGYRGKINVTGSNSSGSNSYTFSSKDNGVALISYNLNTLGTQTIKVADALNAAIFTTIAVDVLKK